MNHSDSGPFDRELRGSSERQRWTKWVRAPRARHAALGAVQLSSLIGFLLFASLQIAVRVPELVVEIFFFFFFIWLIRFSKSPKPEGLGKESLLC